MAHLGPAHAYALRGYKNRGGGVMRRKMAGVFTACMLVASVALASAQSSPQAAAWQPPQPAANNPLFDPNDPRAEKMTSQLRQLALAGSVSV